MTKASGFAPPIESGSLHNDENITTGNMDYKDYYFGARVYPSRVPKNSGFLLLARFDDGAGAASDERFTPPADASTPFAGTTGSSDGCFGTAGVATSPAVAFAVSLADASAFAFASASQIGRAHV